MYTNQYGCLEKKVYAGVACYNTTRGATDCGQKKCWYQTVIHWNVVEIFIRCKLEFTITLQHGYIVLPTTMGKIYFEVICDQMK